MNFNLLLVNVLKNGLFVVCFFMCSVIFIMFECDILIMMKRRKLLTSIGTLALGTGTVSGLSQEDEPTTPTDDGPDPQCAWCFDSGSKRTVNYTQLGNLYLYSTAKDEEGNPGRFKGSVDVIWRGERGVNANKITIYVDVHADGWNPRITDAPPRFWIHGNTASFSTSNYDSNSFNISYGWVYGKDDYCGPDMSHDVQAVVNHGSGQVTESHTLNPCN